MYLSLSAIMLSCTAIAHRQSSMSLLELATYVGLMGTGLGPLYSQTMMTLEEIVPIGKRAAGVLYVCHTTGFLVISWGLGQAADEHPYLPFLLCAIAAALLIIGFGAFAMMHNSICRLLVKK